MYNFANAQENDLKTIVVKIGSSILAGDKDGLDAKRISNIASDVTAVQKMGYDVVVVSSGAVAAGIRKLGFKEKPRDIQLKQAAAAVGQSSLMWAYEKSFGEHGKKVAQILLTFDDFSDRKRYINSKNTLFTLLSYGVVPIINENDTVATDEIKFGDNDHLASLVAGLVCAERLIILSDVDGLFSCDPRKANKAELIHTVSKITPELESICGGAGSIVGTGGMYSKLLAAKKAMAYGITVNIINGRKSGLMVSLMKGSSLGTEFKARDHKLSSRKGWIAYGSRPKGSLNIDDGAVKALVQGRKSLLPAGVVSVEGVFENGDSVFCIDTAGKRIAKGISNYSSAEIEKIKGRKTSDIEKILGYKYSDEVINRDNLAVL